MVWDLGIWRRMFKLGILSYKDSKYNSQIVPYKLIYK